jgi:hypothetical protein
VSKETHYSVKRDPLREIDRGERGITGRQRRERETEERERDRGEREITGARGNFVGLQFPLALVQEYTVRCQKK